MNDGHVGKAERREALDDYLLYAAIRDRDHVLQRPIGRIQLVDCSKDGHAADRHKMPILVIIEEANEFESLVDAIACPQDLEGSASMIARADNHYARRFTHGSSFRSPGAQAGATREVVTHRRRCSISGAGGPLISAHSLRSRADGGSTNSVKARPMPSP